MRYLLECGVTFDVKEKVRETLHPEALREEDPVEEVLHPEKNSGEDELADWPEEVCSCFEVIDFDALKEYAATKKDKRQAELGKYIARVEMHGAADIQSGATRR